MAGFIFPNASYVVSYNFSEAFTQHLKNLATSINVKFTFDSDAVGLATTLGKLKYCVGIFINLDGLPLEEVKEIIKTLDKFNFTSRLFDQSNRLKSNAIIKDKVDDQLLTKSFQECLAGMQIPKLADLLTFSTKIILPSTMKHLNTEFNPVDHDVDEAQFNHVVICDSTSEEFFGRCVLKFSMEKLKVNVAQYSKWENQKIVDMLFEFMNQYIGLINHNLANLGIKGRVGLPAYYDLSVTKISKTGPYIPMVNISDKREIMILSMGFINTKGGKNFALDELEFTERESEFEMI